MAAFPLLHGTRVGLLQGTPEKSKGRPCKRCGVVAERRPTTTICRDCQTVMSAAERALWKAAA